MDGSIQKIAISKNESQKRNVFNSLVAIEQNAEKIIVNFYLR